LVGLLTLALIWAFGHIWLVLRAQAGVAIPAATTPPGLALSVRKR